MTRLAGKSSVYLLLVIIFDLQDELRVIMTNGIDYRRTYKKQDSIIVGQVIDEVSAITSFLMYTDAEKLPTIHRISLGATLRNVDWGCD